MEDTVKEAYTSTQATAFGHKVRTVSSVSVSANILGSQDIETSISHIVVT